MIAVMALPPFFGEGDQGQPMDEDGCLLKEIAEMPVPLEVAVGELSRGCFYRDTSRTLVTTYWMNHCEHCGAKQGDFFVLGTDGPFFPYDDVDMDRIQASRLEGPFRFTDARTCYSGAAAAWRDRRHGVVRPPRKLRSARKRPATAAIGLT